MNTEPAPLDLDAIRRRHAEDDAWFRAGRPGAKVVEHAAHHDRGALLVALDALRAELESAKAERDRWFEYREERIKSLQNALVETEKERRELFVQNTELVALVEKADAERDTALAALAALAGRDTTTGADE